MDVISLDGNMSYKQKTKLKYGGHCIEISGILFSLTVCLFFIHIDLNLSMCFKLDSPIICHVCEYNRDLSSYLD